MTAIGRSGLSKVQDNKAKEIVLSAYADVVKDFALQLYSLVSKARGESLRWQTLGMDSYRVVDREQTLAEAEKLSAINIPSKAFKKHQMFRLATELECDLEPATLLLIKEEIDEAVETAPDMTLQTPEMEAERAKEQAEHSTDESIRLEREKSKAVKPKPKSAIGKKPISKKR